MATVSRLHLLRLRKFRLLEILNQHLMLAAGKDITVSLIEVHQQLRVDRLLHGLEECIFLFYRQMRKIPTKYQLA